MKMPDPPEYVLYTDSELDMVRSQYFTLLRTGKEKDCKLSKELCCRLIRNTVTSMVAILRASPMGNKVKYPSKLEMTTMAQKIVEYYPMLRDDNTNMPYVTVYAKMYKRLQNMRSPMKRQGSMPQRGSAKKTHVTICPCRPEQSGETSSEMSSDTSASGSTLLLKSSDELEDTTIAASPLQPLSWKPDNSKLASRQSSSSCADSLSSTPTTSVKDVDSLKMQARHYRTLSNMYKEPNARPNLSDVAQILDLEFQARRAFVDSDVTREEDRPSKVFEAYPCFKDIRNPGEDPGLYPERRPISSPVLLYDGTTCIVAVGNRPVCNLPQEDFWEGMLVLMAYYYTLHLTYPKCVAAVLSVIQTVVICDAIHDQDASGAYKKAIAEWKSFIEK